MGSFVTFSPAAVGSFGSFVVPDSTTAHSAQLLTGNGQLTLDNGPLVGSFVTFSPAAVASFVTFCRAAVGGFVRPVSPTTFVLSAALRTTAHSARHITTGNGQRTTDNGPPVGSLVTISQTAVGSFGAVSRAAVGSFGIFVAAAFSRAPVDSTTRFSSSPSQRHRLTGNGQLTTDNGPLVGSFVTFSPAAVGSFVTFSPAAVGSFVVSFSSAIRFARASSWWQRTTDY